MRILVMKSLFAMIRPLWCNSPLREMSEMVGFRLRGGSIKLSGAQAQGVDMKRNSDVSTRLSGEISFWHMIQYTAAGMIILLSGTLAMIALG